MKSLIITISAFVLACGTVLVIGEPAPVQHTTTEMAAPAVVPDTKDAAEVAADDNDHGARPRLFKKRHDRKK